MSRWPLKPIREVCEVNPRLPRGHGIADDQIVSFLPMAAIDEVSGTIQARHVRCYADVKRGYTHFKNADVLFAKITPCMENGKAAIANDLAGGVGFGSTEFHVLRAKEEVLPEWLFYFIRQPVFRNEAKQNFTGTAGQQRVPTTFLASTTLPVPPLTEQRHIVDLLSRAEGIVRLRREAEKKTAELIPALFLDMFGDPATNPKGWPMASVKDLVAFVSGGTPSKAREDFWVGDLPWVSPKDMKRVGIEDAIDHVSRKVLTETSIKLIPVGSVLIVVRGMILIHTVPVGMSLVPLTINQDMKALVPKDALVGDYLLWLLEVSQSRLLGMVATAAHGTKKLETGDLERLLVPVPPVAKQHEFVSRVREIESIQLQQAIATTKARATFDALLSSTFSR